MFGLDIIGGLISKAPSVPKWNDITLGGAQKSAISENQAALPGIQDLSAKSTAFNLDQITKMLQFSIPGYDQITKSASSNIASMLRGEIPKDVQDQVQTNDAVKALMGGFAGSGAAANLTARDLGLTSLDITQKGLSSAESWLGMMDQMFAPGVVNVSNMFVTPTQQFDAEMQNQQAQWQRSWLKSQIDTAHLPANIVGASLIKTDEQLAQIAASVAGKAAGAMI